MPRLLALVALLVASVASRAAVLGVNYNQFFIQIDASDLRRTKATWVRGFVDYHLFRNGTYRLDSDPGLAKLANLRKSGTRVILNLKFNFQKSDIPNTPRAIATELRYLRPSFDTCDSCSRASIRSPMFS